MRLMDYAKVLSSISPSKLAILSLLFAIVISLSILFSIPPSFPSIAFHSIDCSSSNLPLSSAVDELEGPLRLAGGLTKTIIIAIVNKAYAEGDGYSGGNMLDLFLESLYSGEGTRSLKDSLLVVAMDEAAYGRCEFRRLYCYRLPTNGVDFSGEKIYMSEDFVKMMWQRTFFLLDVLRRGYSFIFTDTDIMWLRNPFPRLSADPNTDLEISTDMFNKERQRPEKSLINTGFYFVRSNNKTRALFELWYAMKNQSEGKKEQDVLIELMDQHIFHKLNLNVTFLDTNYFSGFCQDSKNMSAVVTVHANCCRSITAKVADLGSVLRDWRKFRRSNPAGANGSAVPIPWSGAHPGCARGWLNDTHSLV